MTKRSLFIVSFIILAFASCKKDEDSTSTPNPNPPTNNNPYYFKFTLNGTSYNLNANLPQYMPFNANEVGGYQVGSTSFLPSVGLRLSWPQGDTVKEADVTGLIGQTLSFNSSATIHPEVTFSTDLLSSGWWSEDTSNASYNVKITNVVFLRNDTSFNPLRTYVITGTCNAVMTDGNTISTLTGGEFNFIVSRRDL